MVCIRPCCSRDQGISSRWRESTISYPISLSQMWFYLFFNFFYTGTTSKVLYTQRWRRRSITNGEHVYELLKTPKIQFQRTLTKTSRIRNRSGVRIRA